MAISPYWALANFTKGGLMKKVFTTIGVIFALLVVGYLALNWWTESKHDKPAHEWIQELTDKKDDNKETTDNTVEDETPTEDESTEEEIEVESEDGTQATALIKF